MTFALAMKCDKKDMSDLVQTTSFNKLSASTEDSIKTLRDRVKAIERDLNFK